MEFLNRYFKTDFFSSCSLSQAKGDGEGREGYCNIDGKHRDSQERFPVGWNQQIPLSDRELLGMH